MTVAPGRRPGPPNRSLPRPGPPRLAGWAGAASPRRELVENAEILEPIAGRKLTHFCYPSGDLSAQQTEWLGELGIESATTTRHGFNHPDTPKMLLNRFLDSETISDIEFEAELCGFFETLRRFGIRI